MHTKSRHYRLRRRPKEHGWYRWSESGRYLDLQDQIEPPFPPPMGLAKIKGYLVGNSLVPLHAAVVPSDIDSALKQTVKLYMVELGLPRFALVSATQWFDFKWIYAGMEFGEGTEDQVQEAYEDRESSVDAIRGVSPALDLAFRWETLRRAQEDERRRRIEEERRRRRALEDAARRTADFDTNARRALRMADAELLDWTDLGNGEAEVRYRFDGRRVRCTCNMATLRIVDAGFCLTDHRTGAQGDTRFTLESIPGVLRWVNNRGQLYQDRFDDDWGEDDDW